jgi:putative membrane protein
METRTYSIAVPEDHMNIQLTPTKTVFVLALFNAVAVSFLLAENPMSEPNRVGVQSTAQNPFANQVLLDLHRTNAMEVDMGKLAQSKSNTPAVREYAQDLVTDHEEAQKKVTSLASDRNLFIGESNETSSGETATTYKNDSMNQLDMLKGDDFDRAFLKQMVADHTKSDQTLRAAQSKLDDAPDVKSLVTQLIPVIERHLSRANDLLKQAEKSS